MSTPDNIPTEQDDGNKNSSDMCSDNSDDDAVEHHQRHRDKNIDDEKTGSIKNKVAMTDKPLSPKFKSLKKCNRKPKPSQPDIVKDANVVDDNRVNTTLKTDDNRTFSSSTESPKPHTLAPKTSTAAATVTEETVKVESKIFVSRRKKEETKDDTDAATAKAKVTTVKATTDDESSTEEADNDKGASGNHIASIETHGRKSGNDSKIDNTADVVQKMKTLQPAPVSVSKMAAASAAAAAASLRTIRGSQQGLKTAPPAPSISTKRVIASISAKSSTPSIASKSSKKKKILDKARRQSNLANSNNTDLQRSSQFPFRLHNMLDDADREGHSSIVSWCAGGNSFRIHQPKQMITVLQRYFRQSKFKSFLRQLQGYNFNRITKGKDQGIVSHPMFIRGRRSICALMKRKRAIDSIANATTSTASVDGKSLTALSKSNAGLKRIKKNPDTKKDTKTSPSMTRTGIKQISPKLCGNISEINGIGVPIVSSTTDYRISQQQWQQRGQTLPQQQQQNPLQFNQPVSTTLHQPPIHLQRESSENGMQFHQHRVHQHYQPSTYAPMKQNVTVKPDPQDVLCVNVPNVQHFQGNRKLHSIVQKITSHYFSATDSVKSMIVNEISSRIQNGGSRFLKLAEDGSGWIKCNEQEIFRQVINCFAEVVSGSTNINADYAVGGGMLKQDLSNPREIVSNGISGASSDFRRCVQDVPRDNDVVLRGGPLSEKEGNTYLITMIQANVGQNVDSFEMKRIKCRAILDRMNKRGSRFFLKLKENDTDDNLYCLSDMEAQDVIFTAYCAEEKKIQSLLVNNNNHAAASMQHTISGIDRSAAALQGSQLGSRFTQNDTALVDAIRAGTSQVGEYPPAFFEKRLRGGESDEHVKLLLEVARQERALSLGLQGSVP